MYATVANYLNINIKIKSMQGMHESISYAYWLVLACDRLLIQYPRASERVLRVKFRLIAKVSDGKI